jgi:hypothetical protein
LEILRCLKLNIILHQIGYRNTFTISTLFLLFLFCQTFEILFIICAKIVIFKKKFNHRDLNCKLRMKVTLNLKKSRRPRLLHNFDKPMFIILYTHYLSKISELRKLGAEVQISDLNNYLTIWFQNGKGTTIIWLLSPITTDFWSIGSTFQCIFLCLVKVEG